MDPATLGPGSFWPQPGLPRAILTPGIASWHSFSCHYRSFGGGAVLGLEKHFLLLLLHQLKCSWEASRR